MQPHQHLNYSVVIPTLNEEKHIKFLLTDLKKQTIKPIEVIVVDAKSSDLTPIIANRKAKLMVSPKKSVGYQRNLGGNLAKGEVICFLDADVRLNSHFFEKSLYEFQKNALSIACPYYDIATDIMFVKIYFKYLNFIFFLLQKIIPSGAGPCIFVKKTVFINEKKFSPVLTFQDMEYVRRVGSRNKFGILKSKIITSDRRLRKNGTFKIIILYSVLSVLFTFNLFSISNVFTYRMGEYKD